MSEQVKAIKLRATYESNLSGIHKDMAAIKTIRKRLEKYAIRIPLTLDLSGIKSQAAKAASEYSKAIKKEMSAIKPGSGGAMSAGGILIPPGAQRGLEQYTKAAGTIFKTVSKEGTKAASTFEQVERGLKRITSTNASGGKIGAQIIDTRPIEALKKAMEDIDADFAKQIGLTKGSKGDVAAILESKRAEISKALEGFSSLENTPEYQRAKKSLSTLVKQISEAQPKQAAAADREARAREKAELQDRARRLGNNISRIDRGYAGIIGDTKGNGGDVASVLEQKRNRIARELEKFSGIADSPAFRAAQKAIAKLNAQIAENRPKQAAAADKAARAGASESASKIIQRIDRDTQKKVIANKEEENTAKHLRDQTMRTEELNKAAAKREEILKNTYDRLRKLESLSRERGNYEAADKFQTARRRVGNDLGQVRLDNNRSRNQQNTEYTDRQLGQRLNEIQRIHKVEMERLKVAEQQAMKSKNIAHREQELNRILEARKNLIQRSSLRVSMVSDEANRVGRHSIADRAMNAGAGLQRQAESNYRKMGAAAKASGHQVDFHTNSLVKNAATFVKWYVPAQLVMGGLASISAGARNAVAAERTFKVLNAVFRGTREEAELLARQTLQLAAANGRDAQEAAEAAVSWARLGLTRTQVLMGMETSLRAANVAEISAADATKYLTAQYKAFNQTLTDIPASLDYINSLSNQYNVTPENIFQGIARTATVTKQAGVELRELASIIAIVSDVTGRPGEETGNAMKFILTRIRRPETLDTIKDEFGLDLRQPNGDAKKMTDIFGELAALYPTLNRLEKARLNDLVAGSRQTERYAVIVENWTEILIAQAKASRDSNSADRENAEIMSSVDAQLKQLSTSWTAVMTAFGELGIFAGVSSILEGLSKNINFVSHALNSLHGESSKKGDFSSKFLEKYGDLFDAKGQAIRHVIRIETPFTSLRRAIGTYELLNASDSDKRKTYEAIQNKSRSELPDPLSGMAKDINDRKINVEGIKSMSQAFRNIARDTMGGNVEINKILKQFDDNADSLEALPDGLKKVADARLTIRPMLESGDRKGAASAMVDLADQGDATAKNQLNSLEKDRIANTQKAADVLQFLRNKIVDLNKNMRDAPDTSSQELYQTQIKETEDRLKAAEEAHKSLAGAISNNEVKFISDGESQALDDYIKQISDASELFSNIFNGLASTGIANIDSKLKIGDSILKEEMLQETLNKTNAGIDRYKSEHQSTIDYYEEDGQYNSDPQFVADYKTDIEKIKQEISIRSQIASKIEAELNTVKEINDKIRERIELEKQVAQINQASADARASTASSFSAFDVGATQGDRAINRTKEAISVIKPWGKYNNEKTGTGDSLQDARDLGSITESVTQAKQGLLSMEQRMHQAVAERANLEITITEEARKQREEASKALALASREDQLRAAAAKAFLKNGGKDSFSMQEFQYFSQETRGAISNYLPQNVKGLDDTERNNNRLRSQLDEEIKKLSDSMKPMSDTFNAVTKMLEGTITRLREELTTTSKDGTEIARGSKDETRFNLKMGDVTLNFDLAPTMAKIQETLQGHIDKRFEEEFRKVRNMFGGTRNPNNSAANSAF